MMEVETFRDLCDAPPVFAAFPEAWILHRLLLSGSDNHLAIQLGYSNS